MHFVRAGNKPESRNPFSNNSSNFSPGRSCALHRLVKVSAVPARRDQSSKSKRIVSSKNPLTMRGSLMSTQKRTFSLSTVPAALFCALAFALTAAAQSNKGTITGTITDPNGAVVKDAKVTATNVATGESREGTTNDEGTYTIPALDPGAYKVERTAQGFSPSAINQGE